MPRPYFQKNPWPDFTYRGTVYSLSHLVEHEITVIDSAKIERSIVVTYNDHCFTEKQKPEIDNELFYPHSSRGKEALFSLERYQLSLALPSLIEDMTKKKTWNVEGGNYALVPTINHNGEKVLYAIMFTLDPKKGLPIDLHMCILTAYPHSDKELVTYGCLDFSHLVSLRVKRQHPKLIYDRNRKRPKIT